MKKQNVMTTWDKKQKNRVRVNRLYRVISRLWLTRGYVARVRERLYVLCPVEEQRLQKSILTICGATWSVACLTFYLMFIRSPGIYSFILAVCYSIVLAMEIVRFVTNRVECKVLRQIEKTLNDVRHYFYDAHSISGALQAAEEEAGYEMRIHIESLLEILRAENINLAVEEYNHASKNYFLKLFLAQCVTTQEYGDTEIQGESLFVRNLSDLREDILNYLLQLERLQLEYSGLVFITLFPLMTLPLIRTMAISSLPELSEFYSGIWGKLLPFVYLIGTMAVYTVMLEMQKLDAGSVVRRWLYRIEKNRYITAMLDCWESRHYQKVLRQKRRLRQSGENNTPRLLFLEKILFLCVVGTLGIMVLLYAKVPEAKIHWYEAVVVLLIGMLAYYVPDMRVTYKRSLMRMNMLSEVTQFQTIIMMQMFIPDITVLRILRTMEQFAYIFRESIQDCINEYSYSVEKALLGMKEAESYEPFRRLCDNLLTVDKIGIIHSFEEIWQDRMHFQKQRESDTYRMIKKRSGYAKIMAFIPLLLIMVTYLILPYGREAVRQFSMILEELNAL